MYALLALREEHAPVPKIPKVSTAGNGAEPTSASATTGSPSLIDGHCPLSPPAAAESAPARSTGPFIRRSARIRARKESLPFVPDASPVRPGSDCLSGSDSDGSDMDVCLDRTIVSEHRRKLALEKAAHRAAELRKQCEYETICYYVNLTR